MKNNQQNGFVILIVILIMGAVGLAVAYSVTIFGVDANRMSLVMQQAEEARGLANACAEEGLMQIFIDKHYTGTQILLDGGCSFTVFNLGGKNREVRAVGTAENVTKKIKILVDQVNPDIRVSSWQEVADF